MSISTPAEQGYRMPAEWELHQATWLSWPHNRETWPGKFEPVEPIMVQAVRALAGSETVHINVLNAEHEKHVSTLLEQGGVSGDVQLHRFPTNDAWCRDHGALFLTREQNGKKQLAALDCEFNAWGNKYPPYDLDNAIPRRMAETLDIPHFDAGLVLEGGSIDVNGAGAVLTTEQCLLNPNRNPKFSRGDIEQQLRALLGVEQIIWLGDGIVGDDTDGHVDDLTRFVDADTVVTVVESDSDDDNYQVLQDNLQRLRGITLSDGRGLKIIELPMPAPLYYQKQRLPASYANFYIANKIVLLPCFNDPNDALATRILQDCFPDRNIVGIDCRDLVWGLGTFHCLTQQVPFVH